MEDLKKRYQLPQYSDDVLELVELATHQLRDKLIDT